MARDRSYRQSLGPFGVVIRKARVLLVGAGGIGCELLKNLVLSGFGEVHIVDLDTIDLSNLNRQFLFRHEHIKKPKALVAKETATQFNPGVKIEAHHANIRDSQFDLAWYRQFNIVFNALDNLEARRHVNRMCLLAKLPLIESGTTGFNGQVQFIKNGVTECYDCNEKETPKTYPVCTIRSTPSQPIHCIVWAKSYLFTEIFGQSEEAPDLDHTEDAENAEEIQKLREEAQELSRIRQSIDSDEFGRIIFEKIFSSDIKRLREMEDMWKTRAPPEILNFDELRAKADQLGGSVRQHDQRVWNQTESFQVFLESVEDLRKRLLTAQMGIKTTGTLPHLSFDKDDDDILDFVTAASNLRSSIFKIDSKSKFDVKQMAGNIVPAIATTNAMTAGLCVLEAFKVLRNQWKKSKLLFLETGPARAFSSEALRPPNPKCSVCNQASTTANIDLARATIQNLVDVLKDKLSYNDGLTVRNESTVLYDPDFDDNVSKTLGELGLSKTSILTIVDENVDRPRVDLTLILAEQTFPSDEEPIQVTEIPEIAYQAVEAPAENGNGEHLTETINTNVAAIGDLKRKRSTDIDIEGGNPGKKGKTIESQTNGREVVVEHGGDGPIVLDD